MNADKIPDLWPDELQASEVTPPSTILRTQATSLAHRTKGVLEGRVKSGAKQEAIYHTLFVVAPALGNYQYALLTITHDVKLYPVSMSAEEGRSWTEYNDETEFIEGLRDRLSSAESRRVIGALLTQSRNPDEFITSLDDDLPF